MKFKYTVTVAKRATVEQQTMDDTVEVPNAYIAMAAVTEAIRRCERNFPNLRVVGVTLEEVK